MSRGPYITRSPPHGQFQLPGARLRLRPATSPRHRSLGIVVGRGATIRCGRVQPNKAGGTVRYNAVDTVKWAQCVKLRKPELRGADVVARWTRL